MNKVMILATGLLFNCYSWSTGQSHLVLLDTIALHDAIAITFSPSGDEAFWPVPYRDQRGAYIMHSKKMNGRWTPPDKAFFTTGVYMETMPRISPDGQQLIFFSNRPSQSKPQPHPSDMDFWISRKNNENWSEPEPLEALNTDSIEYYVTFAKNGNMYFTSNRTGGNGKEDIYRAELTSSGYAKPALLAGGINSPELNSIPAISPNEDFLIYFSNSKLPEDYGNGDLYISFRKGNRWSQPLNLGIEVNTDNFEFAPYLSTDGAILYFTRGTPRGGIMRFDKWNYHAMSIATKKLHLKSLKRKAVF